jgi:hypothetical protein
MRRTFITRCKMTFTRAVMGLTAIWLMCVAVCLARTGWISEPKGALDTSQIGRIERIEVTGKVTGGEGPADGFVAVCSVKTVSKQEAFAKQLQIPDYIFGFGTSGSQSEAVRLLTDVELTVSGVRLVVPHNGLNDLARPEIPKLLFVFRKGDKLVLEIYGPDGSEGYEVQFVSDGKRFQHRVIKYDNGPGVKDRPSPLEMSF